MNKEARQALFRITGALFTTFSPVGDVLHQKTACEVQTTPNHSIPDKFPAANDGSQPVLVEQGQGRHNHSARGSLDAGFGQDFSSQSSLDLSSGGQTYDQGRSRQVGNNFKKRGETEPTGADAFVYVLRRADVVHTAGEDKRSIGRQIVNRLDEQVKDIIGFDGDLGTEATLSVLGLPGVDDREVLVSASLNTAQALVSGAEKLAKDVIIQRLGLSDRHVKKAEAVAEGLYQEVIKRLPNPSYADIHNLKPGDLEFIAEQVNQAVATLDKLTIDNALKVANLTARLVTDRFSQPDKKGVARQGLGELTGSLVLTGTASSEAVDLETAKQAVNTNGGKFGFPPSDLELASMAVPDTGLRFETFEGHKVYTVELQRGDSLVALAFRCGITVSELESLNNWPQGRGNTLCLPGTQFKIICPRGKLNHQTGAGLPSDERQVVRSRSGQPTGEQITGNYYQIRRGETLSEIAARSGTTVEAIAAANNIKNPDNILAGQNLVIPRVETSGKTVIEKRQERRARQTNTPFVYVVQEGDNLGQIAKRYGLSVAELQTANKDDVYIKQGNIQPGMYINIMPLTDEARVEQRQQTANLLAAASTFNHRVAKGDTLSSLALRYNIPLQVLAQANNLQELDLEPGTTLQIPRIKGAIVRHPDDIFAGPNMFEQQTALVDQTGQLSISWEELKQGDTIIIPGGEKLSVKLADGNTVVLAGGTQVKFLSRLDQENFYIQVLNPKTGQREIASVRLERDKLVLNQPEDSLHQVVSLPDGTTLKQVQDEKQIKEAIVFNNQGEPSKQIEVGDVLILPTLFSVKDSKADDSQELFPLPAGSQAKILEINNGVLKLQVINSLTGETTVIELEESLLTDSALKQSIGGPNLEATPTAVVVESKGESSLLVGENRIVNIKTREEVDPTVVTQTSLLFYPVDYIYEEHHPWSQEERKLVSRVVDDTNRIIVQVFGEGVKATIPQAFITEHTQTRLQVSIVKPHSTWTHQKNWGFDNEGPWGLSIITPQRYIETQLKFYEAYVSLPHEITHAYGLLPMIENHEEYDFLLGEGQAEAINRLVFPDYYKGKPQFNPKLFLIKESSEGNHDFKGLAMLWLCQEHPEVLREINKSWHEEMPHKGRVPLERFITWGQKAWPKATNEYEESLWPNGFSDWLQTPVLKTP
jgi:LysM repeat protein